MEERKEKKPLMNKKTASLTALGGILLAFGITWAYYTSNLQVINPMHMTHSETSIVEEFNPNSSFLPGETVVKKVAFQNTGKMDVYFRVKVDPEEAWYDMQGNKLELPLTYTDESGTTRDLVCKNWTPYWLPLPTSEQPNPDCEWSEVIDGYRYYNRILKAGQITNDILESITLSPEISNDRHARDYSNKVYKLTFEAEAIPVEGDGMQYGINTEWLMQCTEDENGKLKWSKMTSESTE